MKKEGLKDITPAGAGNVGDLAYGRCFGRRSSQNGDFPAFVLGEEWEWEGKEQVDNKPVVPIILVQPKDIELMKSVRRPTAGMKSIKNTPEFQNDFLKQLNKAAAKQSLRFNLTAIYVGQDRYTTQQI